MDSTLKLPHWDEVQRLRAEVEALKSDNELLRHNLQDTKRQWQASIGENIDRATRALQLEAEAEALRADNKHLRGEFEKAWPDAERYRHLISAEPAWAVSLFENGFSPAEIVDLIDAARAAKEKK